MFAGPNGSGKSTLKTVLRRELLRVYFNPDEMERDMGTHGFLDLGAYGVTITDAGGEGVFPGIGIAGSCGPWRFG